MDRIHLLLGRISGVNSDSKNMGDFSTKLATVSLCTEEPTESEREQCDNG